VYSVIDKVCYNPVSPGQCEQCLCWQHADCVGIDEEQPPEHYLCCICQSPLGMVSIHTCTYRLLRMHSVIVVCLYPALRKNAKYKVSAANENDNHNCLYVHTTV